ncbi:MAG TPA: helix-turn-helix transcriptional regulator [Trebonia sp.]|jgi:transcriptional regulator with XRE-family HTH domain|nr:helix-turn-helix transcriptional regulator [Trebonia sp.]
MIDSPTRVDKDKLLARRTQMRLSRAELARRTQLDASYLYFLETGRRQNTRPVTLGKIADALGCAGEDLMPDKVAT